MLAISLNQPYASLIAVGAKVNETRSFHPEKFCPGVIGQRIAIHATKNFPPSCRRRCYDDACISALWPDLLPLRPNSGSWREVIDNRIFLLPRGVIVATAILRRAWPTNLDAAVDRLSEQEQNFGDYAPGRWAWEMEEIQPVNPPVPALGRLGWWKWEPTPAHAEVTR